MSAYLSLIGRGRGWALIRGWRLFKVGGNSRLGAYSNKYGNRHSGFFFYIFCSNLLLDIDILCYNPVKVDFQ